MGCGSSNNKVLDSYIRPDISEVKMGSGLDSNGNKLKDEKFGSSFGSSNFRRSPPKSAWGNTFMNFSDPGGGIDQYGPILSLSRASRWYNVVGSNQTFSDDEGGFEDGESDSPADPLESSRERKVPSPRSSDSPFDVITSHETASGFTSPTAVFSLTQSDGTTASTSTKSASHKPAMYPENDSQKSSSSSASSKRNSRKGSVDKAMSRRQSMFKIPSVFRFMDTGTDAEEEGVSSNEESVLVPRVLSHLSSSHRQVYYRDHFWWSDKKRVLPDYLRLAELDTNALKIRRRMEPKALVQELTKNCQNKVEKVRVIFRWIAANIFYKKMDPLEPVAQTSLFVYNRRFGNCLGFSNLLKFLLRLSDIASEVIEGIAKGASYVPGADVDVLVDPEAPWRHCWNRVEIDDCSFLCDVTWAREYDINANGAPVLKPSRFKEIWFLTDPEIFIKSHLPLMYDVYHEQFFPDLDEQHLYQPCRTVKQWDNYVWISASAMEWGVKPISHNQSIIWTEDNHLEITFECFNTMTYTYSLTSLSDGKSAQGYVILYCTDSAIVKGHVRLPKMDSYLLRIQASPRIEPDIVTPEKDDSDVIFIYRIEATGSTENLPFFNGRNPAWGLTSEFSESGCSIVDYKGAIYYTDTGKVSIAIKLPTTDVFPHMINYTSVTHPDEDLENMIYAERDGRHMKFELICPKIGDYLLSFWVKNSPDTEHLDVSLNLFIRSSVSADEEHYYPGHHSLWGPQEPIFSLGILPIHPHCSTVVAHNGCCIITIELTQHINVSHRLMKVNGTDISCWKRCVYAEQDGDRLIYHFHLPEQGRFKFKIAGGGHDETSHHVALVYLIENRGEPYKGCLFPEHDNFPWGIRNEFIQLGLECRHFLSTIPVRKHEARLYIKLPDLNVIFSTSFTHGDRPLDHLDNYCVVIRNKNLTDVTVIVRLPSPGYYALRLFEATHCTPLANYLLRSDDDYEGEVYGFEPYSGIYGATEEFLERGLQIISNMTSEIITDNEGKCKITLKVPKTMDLLLLTKRKGKEVKGHLFALRHEDTVTFIFHGKEAGYYQLKGYAKGNKPKPDLLFIFLIHVKEEISQWESFPDCNTVWGLNKDADILGIRVKDSSAVQSLIHNTTGVVSITFQHIKEYHMNGWLKSPHISAEELKMRTFTEKHRNLTVLRISLPSKGYFTLKIGAAKSGAAKYKTIGTFVIHSETDAGKSIGFPEFNNFFEGCKLESPHANPIPADCEQVFKIKIPGAERVRLWEDDGVWKVELNPTDGDVFFGSVNVGGAKNLWITARFPKDSSRGEEGRYRNMLMYKVI